MEPLQRLGQIDIMSMLASTMPPSTDKAQLYAALGGAFPQLSWAAAPTRVQETGEVAIAQAPGPGPIRPQARLPTAQLLMELTQRVSVAPRQYNGENRLFRNADVSGSSSCCMSSTESCMNMHCSTQHVDGELAAAWPWADGCSDDCVRPDCRRPALQKGLRIAQQRHCIMITLLQRRQQRLRLWRRWVPRVDMRTAWMLPACRRCHPAAAPAAPAPLPAPARTLILCHKSAATGPGSRPSGGGPAKSLAPTTCWCVPDASAVPLLHASGCGCAKGVTSSGLMWCVSDSEALNLKRGAQDDDVDVKRAKRMLSNRESARRSRMRKQAECEDLARVVAQLKAENDALRDQNQQLRVENQMLKSQVSFDAAWSLQHPP